jgi:hypothetical protein
MDKNKVGTTCKIHNIDNTGNTVKIGNTRKPGKRFKTSNIDTFLIKLEIAIQENS